MKRVLSSLLFLFVSLVVFSSCKESEDELDEIMNKPLPASAKFLALGDSYTIGEGVATKDRWPAQLSGLLSQQNIEVGEPLVIARTGWTTGDLLRQLRSVSIPSDYGLVTLQIGVNNQYQGRSLDEFRNDFKSLLIISTTLASKDPKNVLVLTIPDWGATPFAAGQNRTLISTQIKQFNDVIKAEAAKAGIAVGEVDDLSLQVQQNPSYLAPDQLHYSGLMYQQWAQRVLPAAKTIVLN
ncbi:MAG: SGNH/GDSL hydrolase family protein [Rufibacter sp.]